MTCVYAQFSRPFLTKTQPVRGGSGEWRTSVGRRGCPARAGAYEGNRTDGASTCGSGRSLDGRSCGGSKTPTRPMTNTLPTTHDRQARAQMPEFRRYRAFAAVPARTAEELGARDDPHVQTHARRGRASRCVDLRRSRARDVAVDLDGSSHDRSRYPPRACVMRRHRCAPSTPELRNASPRGAAERRRAKRTHPPRSAMRWLLHFPSVAIEWW